MFLYHSFFIQRLITYGTCATQNRSLYPFISNAKVSNLIFITLFNYLATLGKDIFLGQNIFLLALPVVL